MAEWGSDCPQDHDEPDENQTIGEQSTVLLQRYIVVRFQRDGVENAPGLADLRRGVAIPSDQEEMWGEIGCMLREIEVLERDTYTQVQRMIEAVPSDSPIEEIVAVAHVIFRDGDISWGRIVGLFDFAYRCVKVVLALSRSRGNPIALVSSCISELIEEVVKFLVIKCARWIINRGGWLAIREYFGSPTWIWSTLIVTSILLVLFFIYKFSR